MKIKTIFIAGIIQGSKKGKVLHNQDYRRDLKKILNKYFPEAKVIDPVSVHPRSAYYAFKTGKKVFHKSIKEALSSDLVIAYLPQASMGTAVEMWECCKSKVPVWTISPLKENWAVKFLSKKVFSSLKEIENYLRKCRGRPSRS
jgi:nucleoside 2-deoxyribosyltransferase